MSGSNDFCPTQDYPSGSDPFGNGGTASKGHCYTTAHQGDTTTTLIDKNTGEKRYVPNNVIEQKQPSGSLDSSKGEAPCTTFGDAKPVPYKSAQNDDSGEAAVNGGKPSSGDTAQSASNSSSSPTGSTVPSGPSGSGSGATASNGSNSGTPGNSNSGANGGSDAPASNTSPSSNTAGNSPGTPASAGDAGTPGSDLSQAVGTFSKPPATGGDLPTAATSASSSAPSSGSTNDSFSPPSTSGGVRAPQLSSSSSVGEGQRSDRSTARSPAADPVQSSSRNPTLASAAALDDLANTTRRITDNAQQKEIIKSALAKQAELQAKAAADNKAVAAPYSSLPPDEQKKRAESAANNLDQIAQKLTTATGGLDTSERTRFALYARNAADKARALAKEIESGNLKSIVQTTDLPPPASVDALVDRMIQYNGLTPKERKQVDLALALKDKISFKGPDGRTFTLPVLHNGYVLDWDKSSTNCSRFISMLMPEVFEDHDVTTFDLEQIWMLDYHGQIDPGTYAKNADRETLIRRAAKHFIALNSQKGARPEPGDLLLYRPYGDAEAHVVLVLDYNPTLFDTTIIEASQSAGTVRSRHFRYTLPGTSIPKGLYILRRKTDSPALIQLANGGGK